MGWFTYTLLTVILTRVSVVVLRFQEMFDGYRRPHRKSSGERGQRRHRELEIQTVVFRFQFQSTLQQGPLPDVSSSEGRSQWQRILQLIMLKISDDFVLNVDLLLNDFVSNVDLTMSNIFVSEIARSYK